MEDRIDEALEAMKREAVDAAALDAARARVWDKLASAAVSGCAEFQPDLRAYLTASVTGGRLVLLEDHLSRCSACRAELATMKGDRRVIAMPQRSSSGLRRWGSLAAAAAIVVSVVYLGRDTIDAWMAPGGPRATVVTASGGLYGMPGGALRPGAAIGEKEHVRTGPGAHAVLRLADGSTVDVNQGTELFVTAAWSGQAIHLQRGDVIVQAAKQRRGHFRVLTRDSIASVKGTVFAVSSGMGGSVVSVVEGSVQVNQPGREVMLAPGQQAASNPALVSSVAQAVSWSPDADEYLQLLASFAKIGQQMAQVSTPVRTSSALLSYLPAGVFLYGAIPNPGGNIGEGMIAAEQEVFQNAAFRAWWTSDTGLQLRRLVERVQSVSSLLGEEVVFSVASTGAHDDAPIVMARVQPEKREALESALNALFADAGETTPPFSVSDELMVISDSPSHLSWAVDRLGQGAGSAFAAAIGDRYRRGAGWLVGIDAAPVIQMSAADDAPPIEFAGLVGVKYLFFEQHSPAGSEENEVTVTFQDARSGVASWLADGGSGGAAEYLPADSLLAGYASVREPGQLFQEFTALVAARQQSLQGEMTQVESKLGAGFVANLPSAMGTEVAFALRGFSVAGPAWMMSALANDPTVIDSSLKTMVDTFNAELGPDDQSSRCVLSQDAAGGRVWHTLTADNGAFGATWTYDGGYLVAASDRATAEQAIATRNGGAALIWSPAFQGQLPSSAAIHPSAFAWLNTKGVLGMFSAFSGNSAVSELLAQHDPVLVVFDGQPGQIHAATRTRLSGTVIDAMLVGSLGRPMSGSQ